MNKLHVWICDDDAFALEAISSALQNFFGQRGWALEITLFHSCKELLSAAEEAFADLILLDIDMPDMDGIHLGLQLRKNNVKTDIIFVSNCENRVFDSFQIMPIGFVRKSNFLKDIAKYLTLYLKCKEKSDKIITVKSNGQIINIMIRDIIYIEGALTKQNIFVKEKKTATTIRSSMNALESILTEYNFLRIHSGYLVNTEYISAIKNPDVILKDGTVLPLSRSHAKETKERFLRIMKESGKVLF